MASSSNSMPSDGKQVLELPFGYKFFPSDDQVIHYLNQKIFGEQLPADIIPTIDVYRLTPDELPLDQFKYGVPGEWFFFTARSDGDLFAKDGYWHPRDLHTEIDLDDKIIGFKQVMDFYWGNLLNGTKSNWTIYEYRINPDALEGGHVLEQAQDKVQNFVACRMRNCDKFQETSEEGAPKRRENFSTSEQVTPSADDANKAENHVNGERK